MTTRRSIKQRRLRQRGFVLVIMTAAAIAMVGALGMAVDMGRLFIIKNETQHFCDSAALAAVLKLDGTTTGITNAKSAATSLADNWNFGTTTVSSPTVEFATSSSGTWTNNPTTNLHDYLYVRVKSTVSVPLYFAPVVMTTKVYKQNVNSQAIAGQVQLTTLNTGLSPYSAVAQDNTVSTLGLVVGKEYMIQQAHFSGGAQCKDLNSADKCFTGNICQDDTKVALWQAASIWGSATSGYWGYQPNNLIKAAILDLIQLQPVGVCVWSTFSTNLANCPAASNIQPSLSNGQKNQQAQDLDTRANQDTYYGSVVTGNGNNAKVTPGTTLSNYNAALAAGTANGRRLLTAPVVWPVTSAVQTTVAGYGLFLLETDNTSASQWYEKDTTGNDAYCAVYAGPALIGGGVAGPASPGAYQAALVQ